FTDLAEWVTRGIDAPESRRATVDEELLVSPKHRGEVGFPNIPGVTYNGLFNALGELDFGPLVSQNRGIITNWGHPPVLATYRVLVPRVTLRRATCSSASATDVLSPSSWRRGRRPVRCAAVRRATRWRASSEQRRWDRSGAPGGRHRRGTRRRFRTRFRPVGSRTRPGSGFPPVPPAGHPRGIWPLLLPCPLSRAGGPTDRLGPWSTPCDEVRRCESPGSFSIHLDAFGHRSPWSRLRRTFHRRRARHRGLPRQACHAIRDEDDGPELCGGQAEVP